MSELPLSTQNGKELVSGITKISIAGYKSLYDESSIEIRPLTILAGANSSGKSSIMQPLLLMKQTLEAPYDPGALKLDGPNLRFTSVGQFLSKQPKEGVTDDLTVEIEAGDISIKNVYKGKTGQGIEVFSTSYSHNGHNLSIWINKNQEEIRKELIEFQNRIREQLQKGVERVVCDIFRKYCSLELFYGLRDDLPVPTVIYSTSPLTRIWNKYIREIIHVQGLRSHPERTYPITAIGENFPGVFENYVASIINFWRETKDERFINLEYALQKLRLAWQLSSTKLNDVQIEIQVSRSPQKDNLEDMVSIADVGFGVSQVLPVLVALFVAKPGQLIYIEQPELHLHPRAQVALAEILADTANAGVRLVVETHSELLLRGIQALMAEGKLTTDKVKLHWFTRQDNGATKIASAHLDEAGAFGDWPEDFGDVSLSLESRYLDAAEARLWNN